MKPASPTRSTPSERAREVRAQADAESAAAAARRPGIGAIAATTRRKSAGRLFKLLVPREMEPFLAGTTEMQLEVDGGTAGIPWELLDSDTPGGGRSRPWAIRAKLLRKLRIADFRAKWPMRLPMRARWSLANPPAIRSSIRGCQAHATRRER